MIIVHGVNGNVTLSKAANSAASALKSAAR
jgi:hypothetical protein